MFDDYNFVEQALEKAVSFLRANLDDFQVIQFDNMVYKSVGLTSNVNDITKLLPFDILGGATAFYDASITGLDDISKS
ncbi:MAG: hypothetical protein ACK42Z_09990, partial [Candidatus Kapaibacteriota bacterium]